MTQHHAKCHCGNLQISCREDPQFVVMCHCEDCQRRTSSAFNLGAWFSKASVTITGKTKTYSRVEHEGIETSYHFCPNCGTSMHWGMPQNTEVIAVAVGAFANPNFHQPTVSFFERQRPPWVNVPENIDRFIGSGKGERVKQ